MRCWVSTGIHDSHTIAGGGRLRGGGWPPGPALHHYDSRGSSTPPTFGPSFCIRQRPQSRPQQHPGLEPPSRWPHPHPTPLTYSRHSYSPQPKRKDHPQAAGSRAQGSSFRHKTPPSQKEKEDTREKSRQESSQDAVRNFVDVYHHVDALQYLSAAQAPDGVHGLHPAGTLGLLLLPMLHK